MKHLRFHGKIQIRVSLEANDFCHDNCKATNDSRFQKDNVSSALGYFTFICNTLRKSSPQTMAKFELRSETRLRPNISFELVPDNGEIWASTFGGCGRIDGTSWASNDGQILAWKFEPRLTEVVASKNGEIWVQPWRIFVLLLLFMPFLFGFT